MANQNKRNCQAVYTSFRNPDFAPEERVGAEHMIEMMLVARQQIILRKASHHENDEQQVL